MTMQTIDLDSKAIHETVSDYYGGWYGADFERIGRSLHADLAKRAIKHDDTGKEYLLHLTKETMVQGTRQGGGSDAPPEKHHWTITILDRYEEIATVKVVAGEYVEYIHLAKPNGQWLIVNVIYTSNRTGK